MHPEDTPPIDIEVPLPVETVDETTQSWQDFNTPTEQQVEPCVGCPDPAKPFFEQKAEVDEIVDEANTQEVMPGITLGGQADSIGSDEIEKRFGFHKATIEGPNATLPRHKDLRLAYREFAEYLDSVLPAGRERDIAFENLENASMWSHKSIAQAAPIEGEA